MISLPRKVIDCLPALSVHIYFLFYSGRLFMKDMMFDFSIFSSNFNIPLSRTNKAPADGPILVLLPFVSSDGTMRESLTIEQFLLILKF